ncbi:MAG: SMP-30/gluconolactonase/LRE family protein, partial [Cyclobacteriaceae bacterium]
MKISVLFLFAFLSMLSCKVTQEEAVTLGSIERADPSLDQLIEPSATIEVLSDGYEWSEGPVWVESEKMLLFSDVHTNTVYKWTEADSIEVFLKPSGYTGQSSS